MCLSYFRVSEIKFHHCWPLVEDCLWAPPGKFTIALTRGKNLSDAHVVIVMYM